ncbi:MAG: hypothetical protein Tsb0020_52500 [Haliangiales bacterium]
MSQSMKETIAVIGLGYVGLPVALSFAKKYPTIGFDISQRRIDGLRGGHDITAEVEDEELKSSTIRFSADPKDLAEATFIVVAVPTPIDGDNRPDLSPLVSASELVGKQLAKGAVVVYESTVYPGVTEEVCGPAITPWNRRISASARPSRTSTSSTVLSSPPIRVNR